MTLINALVVPIITSPIEDLRKLSSINPIMSQIRLSDLDLATNILRIRLSTKVPLGVNIVCPISAEQPRNLNDHPGRFIGYFTTLRCGDPSFVWLSRNYSEVPGITHVHIYYVNKRVKEVREEELNRFKDKGLACHVRFCAVNILSRVPKFLDLHILIQSIEATIRSCKLPLHSFQEYGVASGCYLVGSRMAPEPDANCEAYNPLEMCPIWGKIRSLKYKWLTVNVLGCPETLSPDFDVIKFVLSRYKHAVYAIHYKTIRVLMFLIPHPFIFRTREDYQEVTSYLFKALGTYKLKFMGATRYYGSRNAKCNDDEVLKACLLALEYPAVMLKHCDVEGLIDDAYFHRMASVENPGSQLSLSQESLRTVYPEFDHHRDVNEYIQFNLAGEGEILGDRPADMSIASPEVSTQATLTFSPQDVMTELRSFRAGLELKQDLNELFVPPMIAVQPYDDRARDFLHDIALFVNCFKSYANLWTAYTTVKVLDPIRVCEAASNIMSVFDDRFVLQPFVQRNVVFVVILDNKKNEWAYINPYAGKDSDKDTAYPDILQRLKSEAKTLKELPCRAISLTSYFHKEFPKMHILMGLFYIAKLFKYAIELPQRVFYLERDFRHFCWRLCYALQAANAEYNMFKNLVKANGYEKIGAKRSMGSPVSYTAAVVSPKECPFCLTRKSTNLGKHMAMAHGGQAKDARNWRKIREEM